MTTTTQSWLADASPRGRAAIRTIWAWFSAKASRTLVYSIDRMDGRTEYAVCVDTVGETIVQAVGDNKLKVWNKALEVVSEYEARKL